MKKARVVATVGEPEAPPAPAPQRVLLLTMADGKQQKLVIDADIKLTFGPSVPYAPKTGGGRGPVGSQWPNSPVNEYALRLYKGTKENGLIACFPGVREFWDSAITVLPW